MYLSTYNNKNPKQKQIRLFPFLKNKISIYIHIGSRVPNQKSGAQIRVRVRASPFLAKLSLLAAVENDW